MFKFITLTILMSLGVSSFANGLKVDSKDLIFIDVIHEVQDECESKRVDLIAELKTKNYVLIDTPRCVRASQGQSYISRVSILRR